ncbi:MAG TPA: formate--tetrahydrofolate ligase [Chloroflexota bacterium]|nr:formate--tetrahydrofolate ligase [Chloroflexota bacterium]
MTHSARPLTDLEIARSISLQPIQSIAERLGILDAEVDPFGKYIGKIDAPAILERLKDRPNGRYIDVTGITPTPLGEGKSLTTVGLSIALNRIGKSTIGTIRQPSMGPLFGIKGGAAGGGYSQVLPMESFNLHLTGDTHAVSLAHNLLAAVIDSHIMHGNALDIDPVSVTWPRVIDLNDRALRHVVVGLGGAVNGQARETRFDIAVASEVMAVLALARDWRDLRERLAQITIGYDKHKKPIRAGDLGVAGSMAVLLKDALRPNLLQTTEHTPMLVHTGPFGNIAHGNSSVLADLAGLKLADYVVTESGFGADMGFEKFMDIKCRAAGVLPDAAVVVCTVRALKMHSGRFRIVAGKPLDPGLAVEDLESVSLGADNLRKHLENVRTLGVPAVVAINRFKTDTAAELELVRQIAIEAGAVDAQVSQVWEFGGEGGRGLAEAVVAAAEAGGRANGSGPHQLYSNDMSIKDKIATIARTMYGADGVEYLPEADRQIRQYTALGLDKLPICVAKTQYSLSDNAALKGRPTGFTVMVREVRAYTGAGFLCPIAGEVMTMPGLPSNAAYQQIDLDENGEIIGLF